MRSGRRGVRREVFVEELTGLSAVNDVFVIKLVAMVRVLRVGLLCAVS